MKPQLPKQEDSRSSANNYPAETYEILVKGQLDSLWDQWFEGMTLSSVENGETGVPCTLIAGQVADQSALHGMLVKIRNLNLKLLSVRRISPKTKVSEEINIDLTK